MRDHGWHVMTKCTACALLLNADLRLIARVKGPDFSLWNARAPCKRVGCNGVVKFVGRPPQMGRATQLVLEVEWVGGDRRYGPRQR